MALETDDTCAFPAAQLWLFSKNWFHAELMKLHVQGSSAGSEQSLHSLRDCLELEAHKWAIRSFEERHCSALSPWPVSSPSEDCGGKKLLQGISGWSPAWWWRGDQLRGRPDLVTRDIFTFLLVPLRLSLLLRLRDVICCTDLLPQGLKRSWDFLLTVRKGWIASKLLS